MGSEMCIRDSTKSAQYSLKTRGALGALAQNICGFWVDVVDSYGSEGCFLDVAKSSECDIFSGALGGHKSFLNLPGFI